MNRYLSLLAVLPILLTACKKEKIGHDLPVYPAYYTYLPLVPGNTWNYIHNGDTRDTVESIVAQDSYSINSISFSDVVNSNGDTYYAQDDDRYYMLVQDQDVDIPVPILDERGLPVFETDSSLEVALSPRIETTLTMDQYNTWTVNGKTYDTVIHTRLELKFTDDPLRAPENYDFYFARNIGIIELDKGIYGGIGDTLTLINFYYDPNSTLGTRRKNLPVSKKEIFRPGE